MKLDPFPMEHLVRKPVESSRAYNQRRKVTALAMLLAIALAIALAVILLGCGGSPAAFKQDPPPPVVAPLSATDVVNLVQAAATSANVDTMAIAVVDRGGAVLAVYDKAGVVPGATDAPTADLYGIENTNRGCTLSTNFLPGMAVNPSTSLTGGTGPGILTGKSQLDDSDPNAVNPGGVPIFLDGVVVGGIGVAGVSPDIAEFAALTAGTFNGGYLAGFSPIASSGQPPEGDLIAPTNGPLGGLTVAEVLQILNNAEATANTTRAAIRLPLGSRAKMVIAVADLDGTLIGLRRMTDSTVFSIDVAASKARNMVYFSGPTRTTVDLPGVPMGTAVTSRTISFGSQPLFPPGINGSPNGPFFNLFLQDVQNPCTQGNQTGAPNNNKSGVVFFPGAVGLYKNGTLVGGLGISGDGVDQDDYVTSGGSTGFEAPTAIRADQIFINGVRLPYFKFPRNPTF